MIVYTLSNIPTTEAALRAVNYWRGVDLAALTQVPLAHGPWALGAEPPDPDEPDYPGAIIYPRLADAILALDSRKSCMVGIYEVLLGTRVNGEIAEEPEDVVWARDTLPLDVGAVFSDPMWDHAYSLKHYWRSGAVRTPPRYLRVHAPIRRRVAEESISMVRGGHGWFPSRFEKLRQDVIAKTLAQAKPIVTGMVAEAPVIIDDPIIIDDPTRTIPPTDAKFAKWLRFQAWVNDLEDRLNPVESEDSYTIRAGSRLSFVSVGMIVHPPDCANCERGGHPSVCSPLVAGYFETRKRLPMATLLYHNGLQTESKVSELERNWRLARDFDQTQHYTGRWGEPPLGSTWPVAETVPIVVSPAPMTQGQRAFLGLLGLAEVEG